MTTTHDSIPQGMQSFLLAGQQIAANFMQTLASQKSFVFSGQSADTEHLRDFPLPDSKILLEVQRGYLDRHTKLWNSMLQGQQQNGEDAFCVPPEPGDRRFSSADWRSSPVYDYVQQAYRLNVRFVHELVEAVPIKDSKAKERVRFLARQYTDAMAPSNFAATNPEFVRTAIETEGKSITDGIAHLVEDIRKGRITITDESAFEVGRNLAVTPGSVVFENEVMQLIQYVPTTPKVAKRPLLIVPPCINKYYILDLQPENSLVRFAVEQGNTVFLVSWRNPKADCAHLTWHDYIEKAPLKAIDLVCDICKVKEINTLGFCVGGTLLASALGVIEGRGQRNPVASMTLLTSLLDFSEPGEIGLFIDKDIVAAREAVMGQGGIMPAHELSGTFSSLRANDLIWNYVSNNYLKGKKPSAFDLLYWNSDSTNLPGPFACWYMRHMYVDNGLAVPGQVEMCGVPVDLGKVKVPTYVLATREDHIVPWQGAYRSMRLLGGQVRFVLGASGHIAGVVNPAAKNKRSHWLGDDQSADADAWFADAEEKPGSWWVDWAAWLKTHAGGERAAPEKAGSAKWPPIEAAPGRFVKETI